MDQSGIPEHMNLAEHDKAALKTAKNREKRLKKAQ